MHKNEEFHNGKLHILCSDIHIRITYFILLFFLYALWNHEKARGFLMFSRGIAWDQWQNKSRSSLFILALSVPCGKVRDSRIVEASRAFIIVVKVSERKASQRQREVYFTFKSLLILQIFKWFYILAIVIVTIMTNKIIKKHCRKFHGS